MDWKKLPYWLKGVIIAEIILLIQFFGLYLCGFLVNSMACLFFVPSMFIYNIIGLESLDYELGLIFSQSLRPIIAWFTLFVMHFVVGAFIGWIIGRIKSKK